MPPPSTSLRVMPKVLPGDKPEVFKVRIASSPLSVVDPVQIELSIIAWFALSKVSS
jgi:hypothetical protein